MLIVNVHVTGIFFLIDAASLWLSKEFLGIIEVQKNLRIILIDSLDRYCKYLQKFFRDVLYKYHIVIKKSE